MISAEQKAVVAGQADVIRRVAGRVNNLQTVCDIAFHQRAVDGIRRAEIGDHPQQRRLRLCAKRGSIAYMVVVRVGGDYCRGSGGSDRRQDCGQVDRIVGTGVDHQKARRRIDEIGVGPTVCHQVGIARHDPANT